MTPFFYSVRTFARIRQHHFTKYWGDGCMGRPPPQISGASPSPPRYPPIPLFSLLVRCYYYLANWSENASVVRN